VDKTPGTKADVKTAVDATVQEIKEYFDERTHDAETRLPPGFVGHSAGSDVRPGKTERATHTAQRYYHRAPPRDIVWVGARALARQPPLWSTTDRRAECGKSARPVWREGEPPILLSLPPRVSTQLQDTTPERRVTALDICVLSLESRNQGPEITFPSLLWNLRSAASGGL
jgi:hypothetical protein